MEKNIDELEKENLKYDVALRMANINIKTLLDKNSELQEKINKALDYIEKIYNSNTEIVENSDGEHIDVGYAMPALDDIKKLLKGDE